ncbi:MAG: hypothetical protein Q4G45_06580 [Actinomycetia bacterium]|nr:hypothetical protein [Actinomycetes bacterium]
MSTEDQPEPSPQALRQTLAWVLAFLTLCLLVGVIAGIVWWRVVELPTYTVGDSFTAATTERGLTEVFATDAWFSGIGLVTGTGLGVLAWRWFGTLGPVVNLIAVLGCLVSALVCRGTGATLGPGDFNARLASAQPGDVIPIQFELHTWVCVLVWVFASVSPILVRVSVGPDPEEQPEPPRPTSQVPEASLTSGEVVGHDIAPIPLEPEPRPRRLLGLRLPTRRG